MSFILFAYIICNLMFYGFVISVTTVESGAMALQYLGLDGDKGASGLKVTPFTHLLGY